MQMVSLQPLGTCLNDTRANVGLQTAQGCKAMPQRSSVLSARDGFRNPQVQVLAAVLGSVLHTDDASPVPWPYRIHEGGQVEEI